MANNTTNETATNETLSNVTADEVSESGMLDGLLDMCAESPELMLMGLVMAAMAAYIAYTVPAVKVLVMPLIKKYDDEIMTHLDAALTKAQMKAYEKLDEAAQKHVKDAMLRNVIMSVYDQNDDKFVAVVKDEALSALAEAKKL